MDNIFAVGIYLVIGICNYVMSTFNGNCEFNSLTTSEYLQIFAVLNIVQGIWLFIHISIYEHPYQQNTYFAGLLIYITVLGFLIVLGLIYLFGSGWWCLKYGQPLSVYILSINIICLLEFILILNIIYDYIMTYG